MSVNYPRSVVKNVRASLVHAFNTQEFYDFGFMHERYDEFVKCKLVDDYGYSIGFHNAKLYAIGNEYGFTHLVHASNECDAHSAAIDEMNTIDPSELPEAYNAFDKLLEFMEAKGHENNVQLRGFCSRWKDFYFYADNKDGQNWDRWELDEAYQMQSNSTGTGIVNVGNNEHLTELKWSQLRAVRKAMVEA